MTRRKEVISFDMEVNLKCPTNWTELSQEQLRYVFLLIAQNFTPDEVIILCLIKWNDIKVIGRSENNQFTLQKDKLIFSIPAIKLSEVASALDFLRDYPNSPVRLDCCDGKNGVDALFFDVPFANYLAIENLFQGYLSTMDDNLLTDIAKLLYPKAMNFKREEKVNCLYWVAAVKDFFAKKFPDFFKPTTGDNLLGNLKSAQENLQEAMNAQIRALTKGDVTKEKQILEMDVHRALTELNAQAKEYEYLNRKMNGNNK